MLFNVLHLSHGIDHANVTAHAHANTHNLFNIFHHVSPKGPNHEQFQYYIPRLKFIFLCNRSLTVSPASKGLKKNVLIF